MFRSNAVKIILILIVVLGIRLTFIRVNGIPEVRDDAAIYSVSAEHIASILKGNPPVQAEILGTILRDRGPFFPLALGITYRFCGIRPMVPIVFNLVFECLSACLIFAIGNKLRFNIGLPAALMFAVSLPNAGMTRYVMTESLVISLLLLSVYFMMRDRPFLCGLFGAFAYFSRPSLIIWPLILLISVWLLAEKKLRVRSIASLIGAMALVFGLTRAGLSTLPKSDKYWSSRSAMALYHGYNVDTEGWAIIVGPGSKPKPSFEEGYQKFTDSFPFDFLRFVITKFGRLWKIPLLGHDIPWMPDRPAFPASIAYWFQWSTLLLACMNLPSSFFSRDRFVFASGLIGLSALIALTYAIPRYAVILLPFVYILAAHSLADRSFSRKDLFLKLSGVLIFVLLGSAHLHIDHRPVRWNTIEPGQRYVQEIDIPANLPNYNARIWLDLRLMKPGSARVEVKDGDTLLGEIFVGAEKPWESPLWKTLDWTAKPGKSSISVKLISGSAPLAISTGDMTELPGDLLSYGRWSVLGDSRIRHKSHLSSQPAMGIFVEIPPGSGNLIQ